jgi:hypothetical protein
MAPTLYTLAVGMEDDSEPCKQTAKRLYERITQQFPDFTPAGEPLEAL